MATILFVLISLLATLFLLLKKAERSTDTSVPQKKIEVAQVVNEPLGIVFSVPKSFRVTAGDALRLKNPFFLYGFTPLDSEGVECFVSQTRNPKEGEVTLAYLREGLLDQLQKSYGEVDEEEKRIVDLGGVKGAKLTAKYKVGENNYKLIEVVGATQKATTFLGCSAPYSLFPVYQDQFDVLLNSLKITPVE